MTSHDALQVVRYGPPRARETLVETLAQADLILSVSRFNTAQLLEHFPAAAGRIEYVPNGAEDLFYEPAGPAERDALLAAGDPFFAPRAGRGRIGVRLGAGTDWAEIAELVIDSYRVLAPKKLIARLG